MLRCLAVCNRPRGTCVTVDVEPAWLRLRPLPAGPGGVLRGLDAEPPCGHTQMGAWMLRRGARTSAALCAPNPPPPGDLAAQAAAWNWLRSRGVLGGQAACRAKIAVVGARLVSRSSYGKSQHPPDCPHRGAEVTSIACIERPLPYRSTSSPTAERKCGIRAHANAGVRWWRSDSTGC
jgi:hypothetical protein